MLSPFAHRRNKVALACAVLVAAGLLSHCRGFFSPERSLRVSARLLADEPTELFRKESLVQTETIFRWSLEKREDLAPWRIQKGLRILELAGGGMRLSLPDRSTILARNVQIEAAEIDAIEVEVLPLRPGAITLSWAARKQDYAPERELTISSRSRESDFVTSTFHLRSHPGWKGTIGKIRLLCGRDRYAIREIRGVRTRYEPELVARAVSRPWKVELGSEVRSAVLSPPGSPLEWPVELEPGSVLQFAYGAQPDMSVPVGFRVTARRPGAAETLLFEETLEPGRDPVSGWRERTLDLSALRRGAWTLALETFVDGADFDPSLGLPAWGHPELLAPSREPAPPDIVLISLDTLRADHLPLYGYSRPTTPNLDRWAHRGAAIFENAIAPTPSTLLSHASLLSGVWSLRIGIGRSGRIPRDIRLLAEHLKAAGYSTGAVTGGAWLHPHYGFAQGFDVMRYWSEALGADGELEQGVERVGRWLQAAPRRPLFLFLHTYEIHSPYHPRQPFLESFGGPPDDGSSNRSVSYPSIQTDDGEAPARRPALSGGKEAPREISDEELIAYYDASIAYADSKLVRVFQILEETGRAENTIVVVTSDHGESLGERGQLGHGVLYDTNLKVPLLVAGPGLGDGLRRFSEQVSLVDVVPSLLDLADLPLPDSLDGTSFAPLLENSGDFRRREVWAYSPFVGLALRIANQYKYIYRTQVLRPGVGGEELYALEADPGEEHDLAASSTQTARLRERVREFLSSSHRGVRLRLENSGDRRFVATLESDLLFPGVALTSPDMACPCLRRNQPGHAQLEVPAGEAFTVFFGAKEAQRLRLQGRVEGGSSLDETIDLAALAEPWSRSWDGSRWRATPDRAGQKLGVRVWWEGDRSPEVEEMTEPDRELVERLRALGYLD